MIDQFFQTFYLLWILPAALIYCKLVAFSVSWQIGEAGFTEQVVKFLRTHSSRIIRYTIFVLYVGMIRAMGGEWADSILTGTVFVYMFPFVLRQALKPVDRTRNRARR